MGNLKNLEIEEKDMGYRSEVVLAVSKKMVPHFLTVMAQCEGVRGMIQDCETFNENYLDEGGMLMHWAHVKWYETYPEVAAIEKFICDCESEDVAGWSIEDSEEEGETWNHVRFVRIGEERDDNDTRGHFAWENIDLMRSIAF
tara:strand:- start:27 stop:455 length:429 start_codon:yes stop_codon:yes gene_type:complete